MVIFQKKPLASRSTFGIILILAPLIFTFAIALDIYVPSIPEVKQYFGVNQKVMQLTVSLFLLITGLGQLLFGPIADQIGRRKVVLASIFLLILGSLCCTIAFHITFLILGRMIQALGACGMMVTCFSIVRDLFSEEECARVYSFLNSTIALSPLLAPLAGGYLAYWINWRATFAALAFIGVIIFFSAKLNINETLNPKNKRLLKTELFTDYVHVLKSRYFLIYAFCASAGFAGFLTFFSSSSYIIINLLHIPEEHFGFYFATIGVVFFIGSMLSGWCVKQLGIYRTVFIGTVVMLLSGLTMLFWFNQVGLTMSGFMCPMMLMGIGGAFLMGGGAGGAISPFPEMAGTASALFGCLQFVFGFLVSQLVLEWHVNSTVPLAYTLSLLGFFAGVAMLVSYQKLRY